jgi:Uncharacterized conserved protein
MIIQETADGSHTLYLPEMDEHYHSVNGAINESRHVYIEAGLNHCSKKEIRVLEMGFGTGLNALLTLEEAEKRNISVHYTSLEKFPLLPEIYTKLNYGERLLDLHQTSWEKFVEITPSFSLLKVETDFNSYSFPDNYDVVYYDAFAPDKQEEVWNQDLFNAIYSSMNPSGILTTYCAKGSIRRMMQQAGFNVERLPGPKGKREMLRAIK